MNVNAILLKPLDGAAAGTPRVFDKADFERLRGMGAVREAGIDDPEPEARNEQADLLEMLRHPEHGPRLVAELKERFEAHERELVDLRGHLSETQVALSTAEHARDEAVDGLVRVTEALAAEQAAHTTTAAELETARAAVPAAEGEGGTPAAEADSEPAPAPRGRGKSER